MTTVELASALGAHPSRKGTEFTATFPGVDQSRAFQQELTHPQRNLAFLQKEFSFTFPDAKLINFSGYIMGKRIRI